ncbi:RES family NAD+ phosphorylase [Pectobacterium aroidearum]|uniref:RES family NAD+ phosphorylase n=1 Tax=Pectobacterium aroidearum TaxID=1201031 RepID=A0ABR5ZHN4_9GAMM|nr:MULTISPECIES: RES family NAD+ phosphorylase [Pectobacterium]MBA5201406.1 RES family NAD+ phosphorylase [Pectobacterium aroidearum]MBA5234096.1 RES family NAD+ phosphorylase [Pectobacterium aroidearum]MBA5739287.1 RES family NAD+ phosphorylase [Pectobacterium aroidearum]MCL6357913.1 RES domain-containing protein [Pectobacterium parmentieri]MCL6384225.1 RES domain-containing protein [Pectobacterium parmentieri]
MSFICPQCVGERYLRYQVQVAAEPENACEYCDRGESAADLWMVATRCEDVLDTFFELSSNTMAVIHFGRTPAGHDLHTTISNLTGMPQEAVEVVVEHLNSLWYDEASGESLYGDDDPWFVLKSSIAEPLGYAWREMEESLRADVRYFNPKAAELLELVFGELINDLDKDGQSIIIEAGPDTSLTTLYRGRVFQTEDALASALQWPERLLGSPVAGIGAAGRMNGQGQPAFYGATAPEICIAEVRPPVGSWIALAAFEVIRPLRLLDLRRLATVVLPSEASLFNPATRPAVERRDFLRELGNRLSAPVMPELQDRDYLVTQVVADYLAAHCRLNIDGIIYPSAQSTHPDEPPAGSNVVLFRKASEVADSEERGGETAEIALWEFEEDGPQKWFHPAILFKDRDEHWYGYRLLHPALSLRRDSIVIHEISAVRYESKSYKVECVSSFNDRC